MRTFIDTMEYYDGELTIRLKPIFETLRQLKNSNVIELNALKGRTLKTLIVPNEKAPEGANFENGASSGIRTHAYRNHNPRS